MVDFIKVQLPSSLIPKLVGNPILQWKGDYNRTTGELYSFPLVAKYNNLKFEIKSPNFIRLSGSIHKFWNNGYNVDDYNMNDVIETIEHLWQVFDIDPFLAILRNVEFGVNIIPPIRSQRLTRQLIEYKGTPFQSMGGLARKRLGVKCIFDQYEIKVYDKKNQWPQLKMQTETLRYELKVKRMVYLRKVNIKSLADLLDPNKLTAMGSLLASTFEHIVLIDKSIRKEHLPGPQQKLLTRWHNPLYIQELRELARKKYEKQRRIYWQIQENYSADNIQQRTIREIQVKWKILSILEQKNGTKLTNFLKQFN